MTGSWNDLTNPDGKGRMFILDDFQEAIGEANLLNGFELNTEEPDEIEQSKETLLEQKEFARGFSTNTIQTLATGAAVIQQAWNGDVVNTRNQVDNPEDFSYETCKEGVPVGSDTMAIPNNARSPGTALLFINWILDPENAAQNVAWHGYPQPVEGGEQEFAKLVKEEPSIDVSLDQLQDKSLEFRFETPEGRQLWDGDLHRGEGLVRMAGGFWTRFLVPPGLWLLALFALPIGLTLALSFGYVDEFGRAAYDRRSRPGARQLRRRVRPDLPAVAGALGHLCVGDDGALPGDRVSDRLLHRALRGPLEVPADRPAGAARSSSTTWCAPTPGSPCWPTRDWSTTS